MRQVECGFAFTQKLEGMFHDIRMSADLTESFRAFVQRMGEGEQVRRVSLELRPQTH